MQAPSPALAARLQSLRQQARIDKGSDIGVVRAWRPAGEAGPALDDWLFVAKQVLTAAELSATGLSVVSGRWRPAGS
jgi:hypothetical protein